MNIVSAKNVGKSYAGHEALKSFSVDIPQGEIFGLLGPNGAGKTTFIRILNNIIGADTGNLTFNGEALNQNHIAQIGYLPEERGLYKTMKVKQQVLYLAQLKGMTKQNALKAIDYWFEKLDLKDWLNAKVEQLSKGMAQKVQFISTVIHNPKLLILDEPFSGFDPVNMNLIKNEILELKEKGASVILSTHNMNSVEEICSRICLINQGEKILDGTIKEIKEQFRPNTFEIQFKGNIIGFANALWTGFELLERKQIDNQNFTATIRLLNDNSLNKLLDTVIPHVQVERVEEVLPNMNDIFMKAITKEEVPNE